MSDIFDIKVIGVAVLLLVIFLISRELICWYWKINESVKLLHDIKQELHLLNNTLHTQFEKETLKNHENLN